jgi:hypothetical protein
MKKELIYMAGILLILTLGMHYKEFIDSPLEQLKSLATSGAYGFGSFHPITFTLIVYVLLWIPRFMIRIFKR